MKQPIRMIRGTTQLINITVNNIDGSTYALADGEILRFGLKKLPEDDKCVVEKELTNANLDEGVYVLTLLPNDTLGLDFGTYYYDVGLQSGTTYINVIECSEFTIGYNITEVSTA